MPFHSSDPIKLKASILNDEIKIDRKMCKIFDEDILPLVLSMLHKDHKRRPNASECLKNPVL